jgi:hypothetical protein
MPEPEELVPEEPGAHSALLEQAPRRAPRIIAVPSLMLAHKEKINAPARARKKRANVATPRAARIPKSDHDRVRTLAKYGMTTEQLIEHYEVAASEIARVIADDNRSC